MHHDPAYERSSAYIDESFSPQRKGTPIKTSILANAGHGDKVIEMLDWIATLLLELDKLRLSRGVLDSRDSPFARDPKRLSRVDRRTVHELCEQKLISGNMEALHYTEIQEPLVWLADAVAWSAQRHISLLSSDYWNRVELMSRIIQLDEEGHPR